MARKTNAHRCSECGHPVGQWVGRCPACGAWGTIAEEAPRQAQRVGVTPIGRAAPHEEERIATGIAGVDAVLGGGLVGGSVVLVAGEPGIGKSTLLLQLLGHVGAAGRGALLASGEETPAQVAARAARLGVGGDVVSFVPGRDLGVVVDAVRAVRPAVVVVDSVQTLRDPEQPSLVGGPSQVRACADALIGLAKAQGTAVILAGQVTKDGEIAGPRTLEHAVDVVLAFDGDPRTGLRVLAGGKNRFGAEGEVAWFEMTAAGLREVDPTGFLRGTAGEPGAAIALVSLGRRAQAVEVQALAVSVNGPPRRSVSGLDPGRFALVAAVAGEVAGIPLGGRELYGAVAGGLRLSDPGTDLAIAAALASASSARPPPAASAFVGEVSLTGAVRPPPNLPARLAAASAAGITTVFAPPGCDPPPGVRIVPVRHLREALAWARRRSSAGARTGATAATAGVRTS